MIQGRNISQRQNTEVGVLLGLVCIVLFYFYRQEFYLWAAMLALGMVLILPLVFKPLAWLWFGFSGLLAMIVPTILLGIIYYLLVFPVGYLRRLMGKDSLQLNKFKKSRSSVLVSVERTFGKQDFERTF
ncbi:MAG: hypothetical protein HC880_05310 [Bacteroidia bacterium]|nr:hypothetical protein [Bacteroidia bacterium]